MRPSLALLASLQGRRSGPQPPLICHIPHLPTREGFYARSINPNLKILCIRQTVKKERRYSYRVEACCCRWWWPVWLSSQLTTLQGNSGWEGVNCAAPLPGSHCATPRLHWHRRHHAPQPDVTAQPRLAAQPTVLDTPASAVTSHARGESRRKKTF